jgi:hypothetical protein
MLNERNIDVQWVWRTIEEPDRQEVGTDNNTHYMRAIEEREGRVLRVVVNEYVEPRRIVTVFFDRRLRGKL